MRIKPRFTREDITPIKRLPAPSFRAKRVSTLPLSIVKEITAQKRNRLFSYASYIEIIGRGTELPSD